MTKKHFRALAANLHDIKPDVAFSNEPEFLVWERATQAVAAVCASTNPRFNRDKFITACKEGL